MPKGMLRLVSGALENAAYIAVQYQCSSQGIQKHQRSTFDNVFLIFITLTSSSTVLMQL